MVLGGGLAGMAAACYLLDDGYPVTLVERRPYLGGRAFSFFYPFQGHQGRQDHQGQEKGNGTPASPGPSSDPDQAPGDADMRPTGFPDVPGCHVDNGQHVFLGCCDYYKRFLDKLGTYDKTVIQPDFRLKVLRVSKDGGKGKAGTLAAAPFIPAPFHMMPSFLAYPHLGIMDKLLVVYGLIRVIFANRHRPQIEQQSFHEWLKGHGQSERAMDYFWNLIIQPSLNDHLKDVSAQMALMVYQEGVLKTRKSANIGYSKVGLSSLMGEAAMDYIQSNGGQVLPGVRVTRLILGDEVGAGPSGGPGKQYPRIEGVEVVGGKVIRGDIYLSALPFHAFSAVLPSRLMDDPFFKGAGQLSSSPIVNIHIWYDRPVMEPSSPPFVASLDSPLQWVFDKGSILAANGAGGSSAETNMPGRYICISVSGAWEYINRPKEELRRIFLEAMEEAFPKAREARVEELLVVKSDATFRCQPGTSQFRPPAKTPIDNLVLAGDWTDTGWPSTMEGAVKSGVEAANAIRTGNLGG